MNRQEKIEELIRKLDTNEDRMLGTASIILDTANSDMGLPLSDILDEGMKNFHKFEDEADNIEEDPNLSETQKKILSVSLRNKACESLTTAASQTDSAIRHAVAEGAPSHVTERISQYDSKVRNLERLSSERSELNTQLMPHLEEQYAEETAENATESNATETVTQSQEPITSATETAQEPRQSLIDDYADPNSEPADWTGGDD
jgi:hypothetical protein